MRELRAIWYNLPVWDEHSTNPLEVSKAEWRSGFKSKLDNQVYKMHAGNLPEHLKINPDYEVSGFNASLNTCCRYKLFAVWSTWVFTELLILYLLHRLVYVYFFSLSLTLGV